MPIDGTLNDVAELGGEDLAIFVREKGGTLEIEGARVLYFSDEKRGRRILPVYLPILLVPVREIHYG